ESAMILLNVAVVPSMRSRFLFALSTISRSQSPFIVIPHLRRIAGDLAAVGRFRLIVSRPVGYRPLAFLEQFVTAIAASTFYLIAWASAISLTMSASRSSRWPNP